MYRNIKHSPILGKCYLQRYIFIEKNKDTYTEYHKFCRPPCLVLTQIAPVTWTMKIRWVALKTMQIMRLGSSLLPTTHNQVKRNAKRLTCTLNSPYVIFSQLNGGSMTIPTC